MKQVRASLGTLAVLGMELMLMDAPPTVHASRPGRGGEAVGNRF